jgi:hypothetical protein
MIPNSRLRPWIALLLIVLGLSASAQAQQSLELPSQSTPSIRPQPEMKLPHRQGNNVQTIPIAPPAIHSQGNSTQELPPIQPQGSAQALPRVMPAQPVLPAVFRGCWRGTVSYLDRIEQIGAWPIGAWIPKTYLLCYRRVGNGPFKLTFTQAGMAGASQIAHPAGQMKLVSSDGRSYATMDAYLKFDEYDPIVHFFTHSSFAVNEATRLQCAVGPDGMRVSGTVLGYRNGSPWFRAWWHTTFEQVKSAPE